MWPPYAGNQTTSFYVLGLIRTRVGRIGRPGDNTVCMLSIHTLLLVRANEILYGFSNMALY